MGYIRFLNCGVEIIRKIIGVLKFNSTQKPFLDELLLEFQAEHLLEYFVEQELEQQMQAQQLMVERLFEPVQLFELELHTG